MSSDYISTTPVTCSTECSNQVSAMSFLSPVTTASLLSADTPALVADLVHPATNDDSNRRVPLAMEDELLTSPSPLMFSVVDSVQPFLNRDMDVSLPTRHQGLLIRPTPWPSFQMHLADGNEVRSVPWPSFACSLEGTPLNYEGLLPQVSDVMKNFSGDLNSPKESWRYLQIVQRKPCQSEQGVCCIHMVLRAIAVPSQQIMQSMENVNLSFVEWRLSISTGLQGYDIPGADRELQPKARPLFEFSQDSRDDPAEATVAITFMQLPSSTCLEHVNAVSIKCSVETISL